MDNEMPEEIMNKIENQLSQIMDFEKAVDKLQPVTEEEIRLSVKAMNNIKDLCASSIKPLLEASSEGEAFADRVKALVYTELEKLSGSFIDGRDFVNAYNCLTIADEFAPTDKQEETKHMLNTFKVLKEGYELAKTKSEQSRLAPEDELLLNHEDIVIHVMFLRAIAGDSRSQYTLGNIYKTPIAERLEPLDIPYNPKKAIQWIKKSAKQGDRGGILALGLCYFTGAGVGQDYVMADKYLQRAKSMGSKEAIEMTRGSGYASLVRDAKKELYAWVGLVVGIIVVILLVVGNF